MERDAKAPRELVNSKKLQVYTELIGRMNLASKMGLGLQYGGDRDIYEALGYQTDILYDDYMKRYRRQDMAKAVIDRPAKATWQGPLDITIPGEPDSELEKKWNTLM